MQRGENDSIAAQCKEHQGNLPRLSSAPPALLLSPAGHIHTHGCREAHRASDIIKDSAGETGITAPATHIGKPVCPTAETTGIHGASTAGPATSPDSECSHSKYPAPSANRPIDDAIRWPDPMSAEVDEIIPVSHGGSATDLCNLEKVHCCCNQLKSDKNLAWARRKAKGAPTVKPTAIPFSTSDW